MFCKFLDDHTAIVSNDINTSSADHTILDNNATILDTLSLSDSPGDFDVYRIPMWSEFDWWLYVDVYYTYTNSLILNDKLFYPVFG